MIYDKTNVCLVNSHESWSVTSDGLTKCIHTMVSLNIYKNGANKFGRKRGFKIENEIEDQDQSIPKLIGILTQVFCTFGPNLVILASTGYELSGRQAQNGVIFVFEVKFDLEGQDQSLPKTIGILTKVFYTIGPNLVILAWTGDELSRGQASDYRTHRRTDGRTHRQTQATTIPEGQNWPRVKKTRVVIKSHSKNMNGQIDELKYQFINCNGHFLWNNYQVNATEHLWRKVHTGPCNSLVPSGDKPLPELMLTYISVIKWHHWAITIQYFFLLSITIKGGAETEWWPTSPGIHTSAGDMRYTQKGHSR